MLVIGSKAAEFHFDNFRKTKDTDIVMYKSDISKLSKFNLKLLKEVKDEYMIFSSDIGNIEVLIADKVDSFKYLLDISSSINETNGFKYATPEMLFSIKKAHINHNIKFDKHILDYCFIGNKIYFKDIPELTNLHRKCTNDRLGVVKTPRLYNKEVNKFFDQSKNYVQSFYIHDNMHKAVAHIDGIPMYTKMQNDTSLANCDKKLWNVFSEQEKMYCVLEEAYVIALERKILPSLFNDNVHYNKLKAFKWALMRICTNLCSGWFRQYACDNYDKILSQYDNNYVNKFFKNINKYEKI